MYQTFLFLPRIAQINTKILVIICVIRGDFLFRKDIMNKSG